VSGPGNANPAAPPIPHDDRQWLHDKYERLASEEGQLSSLRTSYYAAIGTVLITALVVVLADLLGHSSLLTVTVTFLAALGILISVIWAVLLHRTNDAQSLWRQAALQLEREEPPVEGVWQVPITLRSGDVIHPNLLRPFEAHAARFADQRQVSWMDRVDPQSTMEVLPLTFVVIWVAVLATVWVWFLFFQ
jgi:hypothetical protein